MYLLKLDEYPVVFSQALASFLELDGATADDGSLEPGGVTRFIQLLELLVDGSKKSPSCPPWLYKTL